MGNIEMSLYDLNKQGMNTVKPLDKIALNTACFSAADNIWHKSVLPHYWMLLCREQNDYTIFRLTASKDAFAEALIECLENRGKTLDIKEQSDGNYEIWIRSEKENFVYYLFDYDDAVIEV